MKHFLEEKLDSTGLKLVEAHAKLRRIRRPATTDLRELKRWIKEQKDILSAYPDLCPKRRIKLEPGFVRLYCQANPETRGDLKEKEVRSIFDNLEIPSFLADQLELAQLLALALEADRTKRIKAYLAVAGWIVLLKPCFSGADQLGTRIRDVDQLFAVVAQNLEWVAGMLRGRIEDPPGRGNVELARLVDAIFKHQKEPLTQVELYGVLRAAGAELPEDPEAFRLWLHRARKQGLVQNFRPRQSKASAQPKAGSRPAPAAKP